MSLGDTWDIPWIGHLCIREPAHRDKLTFTPTASIESSITPTRMSLHCLKKLDTWREPSCHIVNMQRKAPYAYDSKPRPVFSEAIVLTTASPIQSTNLVFLLSIKAKYTTTCFMKPFPTVSGSTLREENGGRNKK